MNYQTSRILSVSGIFAIALAVVFSPFMVSAVTEDTEITATAASVISITTSATVGINVTPTGSGAMSSNSDTVSVSTNSSTGYTLTLANDDTTLTLDGPSSNTLAADAGTQASPSGTLTNNRWGYRVDSLGGFGAGPTSAENSVASSAYSWAGVPSSASPNTLKTTSAAASNDQTIVWYGAKIDTTKVAGNYVDNVVYSATINP